MRILGIDGGGGGVRASLLTPDGIDRTEIEEGVNLSSIDLERFERVMRRLADWSGKVDAVRAAISGVVSMGRKEEVEEILSRVFAASDVRLMGDVEALLEICPTVEPAIVVVAGTGSVVVSTKGGKKGGWGYLFGDEGSAFWIAVGVIREMLDHMDGVLPYDESFEVVKRHFGLDSYSDIVPLQNDEDFRGKISSLTAHLPLTPLVERLMEEGLGRLAEKAKKLAEEQDIGIVYAYGGVFKNEFALEILRSHLEGIEVVVCEKRVDEELAKMGSGLI